MPYQTRQFIVVSPLIGYGNTVADQINQFLSFNPTISPVAVTTAWRGGRSKSVQLSVTLLYRLGGPVSRFWAFELGGIGSAQPEDTLNTFLGLNPTYTPILITQTGSQAKSDRWRRLLVIVADTSFVTLGATHRAALGKSVLQAAATYGTFYDPTNTARPAVAALNMGNGAWPLGGVNFLVPGISNNPDYHLLGGIAPLCQTGGAFVPPTQPAISSFTGCFPPVQATTTGTGTTTSSTTTGTGTTTSTTTSTTSTSTTSTSTTSTSTSTTSTSTTSTSTTTASSPCSACSTATGTATVTGPFNGSYGFVSFTPGTCTWKYQLSINGHNVVIAVFSGGSWTVSLLQSDGTTLISTQAGAAVTCTSVHLSGAITLPNTSVVTFS